MEDYSMYKPTNLLYTKRNCQNMDRTLHDGQYTIRHKLGWGGFSTVWLARDILRNAQWVSIKIMTSDSRMDSHELPRLLDLAIHAKGNLASKYIVQLLDGFNHPGPNGIHQCLVFELLGPCVDQVLSDHRDEGEPLEPKMILRMCEQVLEAVAFMHEAGFCHGDISTRNIAFKCNQAAHLPEEEFFQVIGDPEIDELARNDGQLLPKGMSSQFVKAATWETWIDEDDEDLRIIDFGETFKQGFEPVKLAQPGSLRAPEIIFEVKFDYRLDLWRVGIVIYSFVFQAIPFHYLGGDDALAEAMIGFVEKLPIEWEPKFQKLLWNAKRKVEDSKGSAQNVPSRLEVMFKEKVKEESLKPLFSVIQGLMRFKPKDRISASHALKLVRAIKRQPDKDEDNNKKGGENEEKED
ncbi:kinase-like protein [Stipitochalara longipes BDJ]|nr:kinase-like protein [Stipitochalara longipes BDJ]